MKVSLQQVRKMKLYTEIRPPQTVYHMTSRENLESILRDGKIKSVRENQTTDYMTFFFPSMEDIPVYIQLTGADRRRRYHDFDGRIHKTPPLNHSETIVLKLTPRGRQEMEWYKEDIDATNQNDSARKLIAYMNNCRICHYGAMPFEKDPEIIELTTIDKMPESEALKEIRKIQAEGRR